MTKPDDVNFKWNSHKDKLTEEFLHLLADEKFVDVTIICESRSLRCHKMILSSCSSLFDKMMTSTQCKHPVVFLADVKFWEIQALVNFMYKGEVNIEEHKVSRLLEVARKLEITGLCDSINVKQEDVEIVDSVPEEILNLEILSEEESISSAQVPNQPRRKRKKVIDETPIQVQTQEVDEPLSPIKFVGIKVEEAVSDEETLETTIQTEVKKEIEVEVLEDCREDPLLHSINRTRDAHPGPSGTPQDDILLNKMTFEEVFTVSRHCESCGLLRKVANTSQPEVSDDKNDLNDEEMQEFCTCLSGSFKRKLCRQTLKKENNRVQKHQRSRKHECEICGKNFIHPVHLRIHLLIHNEEKSHVCDNCGRTFKMYKSFKCHRVICVKKKLYICKHCGEKFSLKRSFFYHLKTHEKRAEKSFNCEICCIAFDNSSNKREHILQVHVEARKFLCDTCGETFVTESAMKLHTITHRRYPCKLCDTVLKTRQDLKAHNVQHHSEKKAVCELCNKSFKDTTTLKKHLMVHIPVSERSVDCEKCSKTFASVVSLRKHVRLFHSNYKPYTCEFCSKSFVQLCKLKYHIATHANDKSISCKVCGKMFSTDKDVKTHMRVHTGEKPFKCSTCGKTFRQRGHVKSHQVVHTKEKPFSCTICNKMFGLSCSLKKHMQVHMTDVNP